MKTCVVPNPMRIIVKNSTCSFNVQRGFQLSVIPEEPRLENEIHTFINALAKTGLMPISEHPSPQKISLITDKSSDLKEEGYNLKISQDSISILAKSAQGLFYGIQTLKQLIFQNIADGQCILDGLEIQDEPRFLHRGLLLDVARHFFDKEVIKRLVDVMALHKLSYFHWHLTDDQGWRIESQKYPELKQNGAFRRETRKDGKPHGGFYSQQDIREIVSYAYDRFITIIPEFDLPGHFGAAIASYPELSCKGEPVEVRTVFGINENIACSAKEGTHQFIKDILEEIVDLFPGDYIHIGGDEVPKSRWKDCPSCKAKMTDNHIKTYKELQVHMMNEIIEFLESKGKKAVLWNDAVKLGEVKKTAVMQYWLERKPNHAVKAVNQGRETILSDYFYLYFDYPHGMTNLEKTYCFNPVFEGIQEDAICNIKGVEAALWTEYVTDEERIHRALFPRLSASSEIGWSSADRKVFQDFLHRYEELEKLLLWKGVKPTSVKEALIKGLKAKWQVLRHFSRIIDKEALKAMAMTIFKKDED